MKGKFNMNEIIVKPDIKKPLTEQRFIMSSTLRERYIECTEVLDKVKPLLLIPYMECMTAMQIADYYAVSEETIFAYYDDYRTEFVSDGARKYKFTEVMHIIESQDTTSSLVKRCKGRAEIKVAEDKIAYIANRGTYLFPKRAILRMGMLLGGSDIAKAVRTKLLDVNIIDIYIDKTPDDVKTEIVFEVNKIKPINNTNDDIVDDTFNQISSTNNNDYICIHGINITPKMYNGQRVVTFKDIDMVHSRPEGTARKRFNDNKKRFIEGEDYYKIQPSEIRTVGITSPNGGTVVTESGYLMLVKSFTDDLAWTVQRELIKSYFRVKQIEKVVTEIVETTENEQQLLNNIVQAYLSGNVAEVMAAASVHAKFLRCQNEQLAERNSMLEEDKKLLIEDNDNLENDKRILAADNALLAEKVLTWTDRSTVVKLINSAAYALHTKEAFLYTDIYKELRFKHHIDLKKRQSLDMTRKKKPLLSYMRDYEWKYLYSSLAAMLQSAGINPILVFKQAKAEDKI